MASSLNFTTPSGQINSPMCSVAPVSRFDKSPPERTASINVNALNMDFAHKPSGQPYSQIYTSPTSCPLRQWRGLPSSPTDFTLILKLYSSLYHFFIIHLLSISFPRHKFGLGSTISIFPNSDLLHSRLLSLKISFPKHILLSSIFASCPLGSLPSELTKSPLCRYNFEQRFYYHCLPLSTGFQPLSPTRKFKACLDVVLFQACSHLLFG